MSYAAHPYLPEAEMAAWADDSDSDDIEQEVALEPVQSIGWQRQGAVICLGVAFAVVLAYGITSLFHPAP